MAQPPHLIKLKRKRGDEPVDTLFIQREGQDVSAQNLDASFKFKRVRNDAHGPSPPRVSVPVTVTFGQNDRSAPKTSAAINTTVPLNPTTAKATATVPPVSPRKRDGNQEPTRAAAEPSLKPKRVFHLSKERSPTILGTLRRSSSASSLKGVGKRGRPAAHGIAVFSEQKITQLEKVLKIDSSSGLAKSILTQSQGQAASEQEAPQQDKPARTQKRPNVSATERKWRAEQRTKTSPSSTDPIGPSTGTPIADANDPSLSIASSLQHFALHQAGPSTTAPPSSEPIPQDPALRSRLLQNFKPLKHAPKPQPLCHRLSVSPRPAASHLESDPESEWVYDTYIRQPATSVSVPTSPPPSVPVFSNDEDAMVIDKPHPDATDGGAANGDGDTGLENIGYLIIRPSDEEAWEVFLSDSEGSDEEEWEGEDDSNAEDYYGNDYPEEEEDWVGSDYGAGSEYGSEDGRWSDEGGR